MKSRRRAAWGMLGLVATIPACASQPEGTVKTPNLEEHSVVGSGTSEDRGAIDASNQKFFNIERGAGDSTNAPAADNVP